MLNISRNTVDQRYNPRGLRRPQDGRGRIPNPRPGRGLNRNTGGCRFNGPGFGAGGGQGGGRGRLG